MELCATLFYHLFGSHFKFLHKTHKKNTFISEMVPQRVISMNFLHSGYTQSHLLLFKKNHCPVSIFGGHLEILHKTQMRIYLRNAVGQSI